ncbi:MAG: sulfurtransferase TusA family protein [Pseudomonadales bacterium]|nr:sulfurtransferase TusA family protein [Pseudomonadales bacterium]
MDEIEIDLRGLLCPVPVTMTAERARHLLPGQVLRLRCTDPGVREDLPLWARMHDHVLLDVSEVGNEIHVRIRIDGTA